MRKLFDFHCCECDTVYEAFVRNDETPTCKKCGATEKQEKQLSFGHGYATDDNSPRTQRDLANYLGNGQYMPGYKRERG